jgi:hypothetical protein
MQPLLKQMIYLDELLNIEGVAKANHMAPSSLKSSFLNSGTRNLSAGKRAGDFWHSSIAVRCSK